MKTFKQNYTSCLSLYLCAHKHFLFLLICIIPPLGVPLIPFAASSIGLYFSNTLQFIIRHHHTYTHSRNTHQRVFHQIKVHLFVSFLLRRVDPKSYIFLLSFLVVLSSYNDDTNEKSSRSHIYDYTQGDKKNRLIYTIISSRSLAPVSLYSLYTVCGE